MGDKACPIGSQRDSFGVDLILDGGSTKIGVELTIVDLTAKLPLILIEENLKETAKNSRI